MQRKVIKVGTSAAVVLPKHILKERKIRIGDMVDLEFNKMSKPSNKSSYQHQIDPRIVEYAEACAEEYKELLKKLVDA